jgi:hypothetical protein
MDKLDLLLWIVGAGFTLNFSIMITMWNTMNHKLEKLDEKITDIDRRLCRLEGAFSSKDCCMIKDDRLIRKVE